MFTQTARLWCECRESLEPQAPLWRGQRVVLLVELYTIRAASSQCGMSFTQSGGVWPSRRSDDISAALQTT